MWGCVAAYKSNVQLTYVTHGTFESDSLLVFAHQIDRTRDDRSD
jgi:hypothetical protein